MSKKLKIGFDVDNPVPDDSPVDFRVYRKKPVTVFASRIDQDFEVKTLEGIMQGRKGDYLVMGIKGELYPIKPDIFAESYEYADEDEEDADCYKLPLIFKEAVKKSNALEKCPHGHRFGKDVRICEEPDCELWEECHDATLLSEDL